MRTDSDSLYHKLIMEGKSEAEAQEISIATDERNAEIQQDLKETEGY